MEVLLALIIIFGSIILIISIISDRLKRSRRQAQIDGNEKLSELSVVINSENTQENNELEELEDSTFSNLDSTLEDKFQAENLYNQANMNARMEKLEEALLLYDKAIFYDNTKPMYFNNRATTLKRLGRFKEAVEQYEEIINKFPDYGKAFLSLASINVELENYKIAVMHYQNFYCAFTDKKFNFNPVVGDINQTVQGKDSLETAFLTSINYLPLEKQKIATDAFNEALSLVDKNNIEKNKMIEIDPNVITNEPIKSGEKDNTVFVVDHQLFAQIYDSYISDFYYHRNDIYIHLKNNNISSSKRWNCDKPRPA